MRFVYLTPTEKYGKLQLAVLCTYFKLNMSVISHQASAGALSFTPFVRLKQVLLGDIIIVSVLLWKHMLYIICSSCQRAQSGLLCVTWMYVECGADPWRLALTGWAVKGSRYMCNLGRWGSHRWWRVCCCCLVEKYFQVGTHANALITHCTDTRSMVCAWATADF